MKDVVRIEANQPIPIEIDKPFFFTGTIPSGGRHFFLTVDGVEIEVELLNLSRPKAAKTEIRLRVGKTGKS
jgi:hypothetical protein